MVDKSDFGAIIKAMRIEIRDRETVKNWISNFTVFFCAQAHGGAIPN